MTTAPDKEELFEGIGLCNGLEIWKLEEDDIVEIEKEQYGEFYDEETYILLHTTTTSLGFTKMYLHYWLGSKCDKEAERVVANFCGEMSTSLRCVSATYRETQNCESDQFEKYFKNGIVYLNGKIPANQNIANYDVKRLFHVEGTIPARATQIGYDWGNFLMDDVFIVDTGHIIIVWKGDQITRRQGSKARVIANNIRRSEREGLAYLHTIEGFGSIHDVSILEHFLGPKPEEIKTSEVVQKSSETEEDKVVTIFALKRGVNNVVELNEEELPSMNKRSLMKDECYLFDVTHQNKIFVWKGHACDDLIKELLWDVILNYIKEAEHSFNVQVQLLEDGGETEEFTQLFCDWEVDEEEVTSISKIKRFTPSEPRFDQPSMPGNGEGTLEVFLWDKESLVAVDEQDYGKFYSRECYVVRFTYQDDNEREMKIIYYWEGRRSGEETQESEDSKDDELAQKKGVKIISRIGGITECRVEIGREPAHFVAFFKGKFRILKGNDAKSTDRSNVQLPNPNKVQGVFLYIIRGTNEYNTKAVQVPCNSSSLNSNYPFLCITPTRAFLWFGKGCIGDQRNMAHLMAENMVDEEKRSQLLAGNVGDENVLHVLEEGHETTSFFTVLQGRNKYMNAVIPVKPDAKHRVRTFECDKDKDGKYRYHEILGMTQKDIRHEDLLLFDIYDEVYIWLGKNVDSEFATECFQVAFTYLKRTPKRSDMKTPVLVVKQGYEPSIFTRLLSSWDSDFELDEPDERLHSGDLKRLVTNRYGLPTYSLEELVSSCPEGVNPRKKEKYLSEQDFLLVFKLTREDFSKKSEWSRNELKKKHKLF
ncbi:unnamed protein product [Clavelina lepadiformis]|uniref:HP domain-containing protein n=1 Tax=Clavelina lepadiformis TaxID=159417 RepID=A0ABP0F688_CLALP